MSLGADLILPKAPSAQPEQSQRSAPREPGQSGFAGLFANVLDGGKAPVDPSIEARGLSQSDPQVLLEEQHLADAGNDLPPVEDALLAEPDAVSLETLLFGRQETPATVTAEQPEQPDADAANPVLATLDNEAPEAEVANQAAGQAMASLAQPAASQAAQAASQAVPMSAAAMANATRASGGRQAEQPLLADEPSRELELSAEDDRDFSQSLRASLAAAATSPSGAAADTPDSPVNPLTQAVQQAAAQREAAAAAQQPLALRQPGLSEAVVERVMWLSSQNLRSAEIQLDPAELGRLEIRISLNQEQAQISFASPHASVREALEGQMHRLREMFAQQGLDQLDVNVSDQSLARGDRQADERDPSALAGNASDTDGELDEETVIASTPLENGRGLVDFYA